MSVTKQFGTLFKLGIAFTFLPLLVVFPAIAIMIFLNTEDYQKYDSDKIEANGKTLEGKIKSIIIDPKFTVNNEKPFTITYQFLLNGTVIQDKMKVLESDLPTKLNEGDKIKVKYLNNESKIENVKSFIFPFYLFYLIPSFFLVVGIIFLFIWYRK